NTPGYDVLFKNIALTKVVPEVKKGDIVLDGNINSLDMMKLKKYLIRETQFNYDELLRADVNSDGEVNSTDYAYLKRYILRIIDAFPQ
ncbi:MAG TPA: dockerin type I repeat-containing protein, partial [Acetivibrio thermocellus]|nr:dockerin type I repeat-containing protein [Acetivibrio thermocellus]